MIESSLDPKLNMQIMFHDGCNIDLGKRWLLFCGSNLLFTALCTGYWHTLQSPGMWVIECWT